MASCLGVADWRDAVQPVPDGIRLLLEVTAGAREARFPDGFNPWREGRIAIRVREPALDNRANLAVAAAVAEFFGVGSASVRIEAGATDSRKTVRVAGVTLTDARSLLEKALERA